MFQLGFYMHCICFNYNNLIEICLTQQPSFKKTFYDIYDVMAWTVQEKIVWATDEQDQHCLTSSNIRLTFDLLFWKWGYTLKNKLKQQSRVIEIKCLSHLKFRRNKALNQQGLKLQIFTQLSDAVQQTFCLPLMLLLLICHLKYKNMQ